MARLAGGEPVFDTLSPTVHATLFQKTWRINSTAAKATICLLAQFHPRSFLSGGQVDLGNALAAYNAREFHHIYPKGFLANIGIPFHESNVIANVCLVTSTDNRTISDRDPADYLGDLPAAERTRILESALIPLPAGDGSKPYAEFLSLRAEALATAASRLITTGSA